MIELKKKDNEVDILIQYKSAVGEKPKIYIEGTGDFSHHLVEGVFDLLDKLAKMESIGHNSQEWRGKRKDI